MQRPQLAHLTFTFTLACSSPTRPVAAGVPAAEGGAPAAGPTTRANDTPASMKPVVEAHNERRARHCAPPLSWSDELAKAAQAWADSLAARGCAFEHSGSRYGENLAAGTESILGPEAVVDMWYREVDDYDFGSGGFSMKSGHFTQLAWVGTSHLGCGAASCKGMRIWVCQYDPPGNVDGEYRANVLPASCRR
jgi:pathogenesis-related protein 1